MSLTLNFVRLFHQAFGHPINNKPVLVCSDATKENLKGSLFYMQQALDTLKLDIPDDETNNSKFIQLRAALIQEELMEMVEGVINEDPVETLDALTDIQYVLDGAYLTFGLGNYKVAAMTEVHQSNMSKLGPDRKPIYDENTKIVKGPNYWKPDLQRLIKDVDDELDVYAQNENYNVGSISFDEWKRQTQIIFSKNSWPDDYVAQVADETWGELYKDGVSPHEAATEEMSNGEQGEAIVAST